MKIAKTHSKAEFEQEYIKNPVAVYKKLATRLRSKNGAINYKTAMPEFGKVIDSLLEKLNSPLMLAVCRLPEHKSLKLQREICYLKVQSLRVQYIDRTIGTLDGQGDPYPHQIIADGAFLYLPTLITVYEAVTFFDVFERTVKQMIIVKSDGEDIKSIPDLYHTNRYAHYAITELLDEDFIFIPSTYSFSLRDLIRLRSAPLGVCGVSEQSMFVDAYPNSPLDFYIHDLNHNRRFKSFNDIYFKKYCAQHGITIDELTLDMKIGIYEQFNQFLEEEILKPTQTLPELNLSEHEKHVRQVMTVLYFQIFHEYAFTPDKESVVKAFKFVPGTKAPFEVMTIDETQQFDSVGVLKRRMPNNNLISGISSVYGNAGAGDRINVNYFFYDGPNFISTSYNQLVHQYFDNKSKPLSTLPPYEQRTPELIAEAAYRIMTDLNLTELLQDENFSKEKLVALAQNEMCMEIYPNDRLQVCVKPEIEAAIVASAAGKTINFQYHKQSKPVPDESVAHKRRALKPTMAKL